MIIRAMIFFGALMTAGCSQSDAVRAPALDLAPIRCPDLPDRDLRTIAWKPIAPPKGDMTKSKAQAWVDRLHEQIRAKTAAGGRVVGQYKACQGGAS